MTRSALSEWVNDADDCCKLTSQLTSWRNPLTERHRKHRQLLSIVRQKGWQEERATNFRESQGEHGEKERDGVTAISCKKGWTIGMFTDSRLSINKSLNCPYDTFVRFWPSASIVKDPDYSTNMFGSFTTKLQIILDKIRINHKFLTLLTFNILGTK